ncbi:MAG: hypothetical protein HYW57_02215 [Ignavibacteriales bacterium]|nr:hypothetical protein [Ignavibacteriales bacterium]
MEIHKPVKIIEDRFFRESTLERFTPFVMEVLRRDAENAFIGRVQEDRVQDSQAFRTSRKRVKGLESPGVAEHRMSFCPDFPDHKRECIRKKIQKANSCCSV